MPKSRKSRHSSRGRRLRPRTHEISHYQAALDFLISWGWIIAIIAVAIIALFALGVFSTPAQQTLISGFNSIKVTEVAVNSSLAVFQLSNSFGQSVNLNNLIVYVNGHPYSSFQCQATNLAVNGVVLCRVPVKINTSTYQMSVSINYAPQTGLPFYSNGTISGPLSSGALPLNSQTITFYEQNLPSGSQWNLTIAKNTLSRKVGVVGGTTISVTLPFGLYVYNVSNSTATGCLNVHPVPIIGTAQTSSTVFITYAGQCVTTFNAPAITNYNWWIDYDNINQSVNSSTTNPLTFSTPLANYSFKGGISTLNCLEAGNVLAGSTVSYGSPYGFCVTTFLESGVSSSYYSSWRTTYNGNANSNSPGKNIQFNTSVGKFTASFSLPGYVCSASNANIVAGSSYTASSWSCTTTFNFGPSTAYYTSGTWSVTYSGTSSQNVGTAITESGSPGSASYSGQMNSYNCPITSSSITAGTTVTPSFTCTTTFSAGGVPSSYSSWNSTYNGVKSSTTSAGTNIVFSSLVPGNYSATFSLTGFTCLGSSAYVVAGLSYTASSWSCTTTFFESGVPSAYYSSWNVTYNNVKSSITAIGTKIQFSNSAAGNFTASFSLPGYVCSANSAHVVAGNSYNASSWSCTTKFSFGPSTAYYTSGTWSVTYSGTSSQSVGTTITESESPGSATYSGQMNSYNCPITSASTTAGTTVTPSFTCTTTFSEGGSVSSSYYPSWNVTYNGIKSSTTSAGTNIVFSGVAPGDPSATFSLTGFNCPGSSASIIAGSSYAASGWSCTTTFSESNVPSQYYPSWNMTYNSVKSSTTAIGTNIVFSGIAPGDPLATISLTGFNCSGGGGNLIAGSSYNIPNWGCTTTFSEGGSVSSSYYPSWNVTYNGIKSSTTSAGTNIFFSVGVVLGEFSATFSLTGFNCPGSSASIIAGSSYAASGWSCTTTFSETGAASYQNGTIPTWSVTYDGIEHSSNGGATIPSGFATSPGSYTATPISQTMQGITMTANAQVVVAGTESTSAFSYVAPGGFVTSNIGNILPLVVTSASSGGPQDIEIDLNSSLYAKWENKNLTNIQFFFANGTVIDSWLESYPNYHMYNSIYWLLLKGDPGTVTIYVGFAPKSKYLINGGNTGANACWFEGGGNGYGVTTKDNGFVVFPYYFNWCLYGNSTGSRLSRVANATDTSGTGWYAYSNPTCATCAYIDNSSYWSGNWSEDPSAGTFAGLVISYTNTGGGWYGVDTAGITNENGVYYNEFNLESSFTDFAGSMYSSPSVDGGNAGTFGGFPSMSLNCYSPSCNGILTNTLMGLSEGHSSGEAGNEIWAGYTGTQYKSAGTNFPTGSSTALDSDNNMIYSIANSCNGFPCIELNGLNFGVWTPSNSLDGNYSTIYNLGACIGTSNELFFLFGNSVDGGVNNQVDLQFLRIRYGNPYYSSALGGTGPNAYSLVKSLGLGFNV